MDFYEYAAEKTGKDLNVTELTKEEEKKLRAEWQELEEQKSTEPHKIEIDSRFKEPELLEHINKELDKLHIGDTKQKIGVFLVLISSLLPIDRDHVSAALKGDSSTGKDNLIDATINCFPIGKATKFTGATNAALRDTVREYRAIAFSEMNKNREGGANADIVEKLKQLSEGGLNETIQEKIKGKWHPIEIKAEQKTTIYSTTETAIDDELHTRYIIIPITGTVEKNRAVLKDTLEKAASTEAIRERYKGPNWIAQGVTELDQELHVIIPYAPILDTPITDENGNETTIFGPLQKDRIKRDQKRLLSLTKSIAWLYQKDRAQHQDGQLRYIVAEPNDFIAAYQIFADFFAMTYAGLDHRLTNLLDLVKQEEGKHAEEIQTAGYGIEYADWVSRNYLQKTLDVSRPTLKKYIKEIEKYGLLTTHYTQEGNIVLVSASRAPITKGIKQGEKGVSEGARLAPLYTLFSGWLTPSIIESVYKGKEIRPIRASFLIHSEKFSPEKFSPSKTEKVYENQEDEGPQKRVRFLRAQDTILMPKGGQLGPFRQGEIADVPEFFAGILSRKGIIEEVAAGE